jgi:dinuclear metal center YbgI/SA1388 family protein
MPTTLDQLESALERIAPLEYAEEWDNVGLLVRGVRDDVDKILLTIDLTEPVLEEAVESCVDTVIAYHPPIFSPLERLGSGSAAERIVLGAVRAGLHVYSPHTALDAAPDGVNDWLIDCLGAGDKRALVSMTSSSDSENCKIVTFCPQDAADRIRDGLAAAGAGTIGEYNRCSFEIPGTGTFHGGERTEPSVGRAGQLERVEEVRLEMICPRKLLAGAVKVLSNFHPYEEPPIEVYTLEPLPIREIGAGRRVILDRSLTIKKIAELVKSRTDVQKIQVARAHERPRRHRTIGLCVGAGGSLLDDAIAQECTVFVTGEMSHHDLLKAQAAGCTVILAGHTDTERGYLGILAKRIASELGQDAPDCVLSRRDRRPLRAS